MELKLESDAFFISEWLDEVDQSVATFVEVDRFRTHADGIHFEGGMVQDVIKQKHEEFSSRVQLFEKAIKLIGKIKGLTVMVENLRKADHGTYRSAEIMADVGDKPGFLKVGFLADEFCVSEFFIGFFEHVFGFNSEGVFSLEPDVEAPEVEGEEGKADYE